VLSNKKVVVVGGGPVGLYFAALLLQSDPTVRIEIIEKQISNPAASNAFGMGVGSRMQQRLRDVPGLLEEAISVSSVVAGLNIPLVSRDDLVRNMRAFLTARYDENACRVALGDGVASVDLRAKRVTTESGRDISYDLLLGADGVNSKIRQLLLDQAELGEQHYLEDFHWKVLQLPKQFESDSFKPLQHPAFRGRVLPRAPEGHFLMLFWKGNQHNFKTGNPVGIHSADDWKRLLNEAIQDKKKSRFRNPARRLFGMDVGDDGKNDHSFVFDEETLDAFTASRAKPVHYLQLERYHHGDVALIGDSAHSFSSLLGQGCALGLESTHTLVECLREAPSLDDALHEYTARATVEAHAMTEVSLVSYGIRGGWNAMTFQAVPLILVNMLRGKGVLKRIKDVNVPYATIVRENRRLLRLCRSQFEKERKPFQKH
tara:strand:+ start:79 stop:1368 length:1290 start_codon:yes stop_codon:yes gene_type:complete